MKVIAKSIIDIESGDIIEEESYEYYGPVAECKGGGDGTKVEYTQSPEQRQVFGAMMPVISDITSAAERGKPVWGIYKMPEVPVWQSAYTGIEKAMPTTEWYNSISPDIKTALWQPYQEAADTLLAQMGGMGMSGAPSAGYSGAAGKALAENIASKAATQIPLTAWSMTGPQLQQAWMEDYSSAKARAIEGYEAEKQRRAEKQASLAYPYTAAPPMIGGAYSQPVVYPQGPSAMQTMGMAGVGGLGGYAAASGGLLGSTMAAHPLLGAGLGAATMLMGGK